MSDDDEPTELVWAAATVSSIDAAAGTFEVEVNEWASLDVTDDDFEEAYSDGPFVLSRPGEYVPEYDGRWMPAESVSALWAAVEGVSGAWWSQDDGSVSLVVPLAAGARAKRDVVCELDDKSVNLAVAPAGLRGCGQQLSLAGRLSHAIKGLESEWYVDDEVGGFANFPPDERFLRIGLVKATRGVSWAAVLLADGAEPDDQVTIKRTDGVTIRRPESVSVQPAKSLLDIFETPPPASPPPDGVKVTIRKKGGKSK